MNMVILNFHHFIIVGVMDGDDGDGCGMLPHGGNKRWLRDFTKAKCDKLHKLRLERFIKFCECLIGRAQQTSLAQTSGSGWGLNRMSDQFL